MQILFLVSAHNSLSQRVWIALTELAHDVPVAVAESSWATETAVWAHAPDLIVCPFLKTVIPESIWRRHCDLIVHPGPRGDRGPSSLDWANELDKPDWGVTVLQATGDVDAGEVWGDANVQHAQGREEPPLSARGPSRGGVVLDAIDRLVLVGVAPSPRTRAALGPCLPLIGQEVPRDRLAVRSHRACPAESTRQRRSPRRARRNRQQALSPIWGLPGADAAWPAGRTNRSA